MAIRISPRVVIVDGWIVDLKERKVIQKPALKRFLPKSNFLELCKHKVKAQDYMQ